MNVANSRARASAWALGIFATLLPAMSIAQTPHLIPTPNSVKSLGGSFHLTRNSAIISDEKSAGTAAQAREVLGLATGFDLASDNSGSRIRFDLDSSLSGLGDEGYRLSMTEDEVTIVSAGEPGLFYGLQTLRQLLPSDIYNDGPVRREEWSAPCVEVEDRPRFGWRGAMMDSARHFMPKEFVLKFLDLLAMHKMNRFHWHLTEDQGWRIEIKKYPKLTEVGAWREETLIGRQQAMTRAQWTFDGIRHGGFYSQEDVREIVAYAAERHITVIPEIEMPGHCQAALAAYPELGNTGKQLPVRTFWGVNSNIYNVKEETFQFQFDVLTEVLELFPSEFIHIGGDEVPKDQWKTSEHAQSVIKANGLHDEHELQSWFIKRIDKWLDDRGRRLIGWDEILEGGLAPGATVMSWRGTAGGIAAAQAGHEVVMAPNSHTYYDHYQSRDYAAEPIAIGGFTDLKKAYSYDPIPKELTQEQAKFVLGAQCQLWSEYIATPAKMEYMAFPRLSALSERVWSTQDQKDYNRFIADMRDGHLARLDAMEVNYRPLDQATFDAAGEWTSGKVSEAFTTHSWDVTKLIKSAGRWEILFQYTGGAHRLDIEWAELLVNGSPVGRDTHEAQTGGRDINNRFVVEIKDLPLNATVELKASIRADGGTDSNGEITVKRLKS